MKIINILGSIVMVIGTFIGCYFSEFSGASLGLGCIIIILLGICQYLFQCNNDLDKRNEQFTNENNSLKDNIKILNDKVSKISIVANQGSPYTVTLLPKLDISNGIKKNKEYTIEVIVSTLDKRYDIRYLNISFNERVEFNQTGILTQDNMYSVTSSVPKQRNGRYEYNLELINNYLNRSCAKCVFKFKYNMVNDLSINIEVSSDNEISKIETFSYSII